MRRTRGFALLAGTSFCWWQRSHRRLGPRSTNRWPPTAAGVESVPSGDDGFLEPPGITDPTEKNFAQPVLSNGVVEITASGPVVTDDPAAKFPEGSSPFALPAPDHPSTNCNPLQP
jgi:hypothetical protein